MGLLSFLSFVSFIVSIIAALLATDIYRLLRTGEVGKSWRILIIASVMSVVLQGLHLVEYLNGFRSSGYPVSKIVELSFILALAYAFYLQRSIFSEAAKERKRMQQRNYDEDLDGPAHDAPAGTVPNPRNKKWTALTH
ncbi:MAG: hypothetical protein M3347_03720 [Armatimonadota bacterium]|nr:hypothetical protein [Armatimonadota bacterium]